MTFNKDEQTKYLSKKLIVYQAPWSWDFLWNRAQPLAKSLSKYCTVVYLDGGLTTSSEEKPKSGELIPISDTLFRYKWNIAKEYQNIPFYFYLQDRNKYDYETFISQIKELLYSHDEIWLLSSRPATVGLLELLKWDKIIVDIEDPWLSLDWGLQIKEKGLIEKLLYQADIIFSNGSAIANEYEIIAGKSIYSLPNGVDSSFVNSLSQSLPCPEFMLKNGLSKRAVFTGHINDRLDFEALQIIVNQNRNIDFYFIGVQNLTRKDARLWQNIKQEPNFHYIPPVRHSEIPAILQHADVLLLPYVHMGAPSMFPAKLYEYLAAQKIILSSIDFYDNSIKIPSLFVCSSTSEFVELLQSIASGTKILSDDEKKLCRQIALDNSWEQRAKSFIEIAKSLSQKLVLKNDVHELNTTPIPAIQPVTITESRPFWSVMIPTYNCADYLVETLKSVLAQDPGSEQMQIEVVDDYSTKDDPEAVVREIGKGRVSFFRQPHNSGIARNFNTCIQRAKGDWVHILHGDDMVLPGFYSRLRESLEKEPTVGAAFCRQIFVNDHGQWQMLSGLERQTPGKLPNWWIELLAISQRIETPSIVVRRSVYEELGGFHLDLSHAADWEMWKRIARHYPIWYEPQPLVYYRRHTASDTSRLIRSGGNVADSRRAIEISESYLPKALATQLSNQSRKNYAFVAINTARRMLAMNDIEATIAQVWEGLNCSDAPEVISSLVSFLKSIDSEKFLVELSNYNKQKQGNETSQSALSKLYQALAEQPTELTTTSPTIVVDGVAFQVLEKAGIIRVWTSLLEEWVNNGFAKYIILLDRARSAPRISGIRYINFPAYSYGDTEGDREMLQQVCDQFSADLFISSYYTTPISTPSVFLAHDMIPEAIGWNLSLSVWRNKHHSIRHAAVHIAVSENTAQDLVKFFPHISLESVIVAKNGVDTQIFSPASSEDISSFKKKYGITKPYFMLVGIDDNRKNRILFFKAFSQFASREGFEIVCTGSDSLLNPELRTYTSGSVVHILELEDEELATAYSGAVALIYPSKYEGFGLPILEAMACGCPVITCPNGSIPEVAGEAAIYVNHEKADELADALGEVQKPSIRKSVIAAGLERVKEFSWSQMANTVSSALIDATLLPLKLKDTNLIIFPDWLQPEEKIGWELQTVIKAIATHPEHENITLLVTTNSISYEDAELFLSSVTMNLLMEEDLDISEYLQISLIGELGDIQWQALLSRMQARITLSYEDKDAIAQIGAENLRSYNLEFSL